MIRTGIPLSITSLLLEVDDFSEFQFSKTASLSVLSFLQRWFKSAELMQRRLGWPPVIGTLPFERFLIQKTGRGCQLMFETQPVSLLAHNSSTVYVHPITFSHLPDWWCKQLEGMEHIRTEHGEGQPCFYFPRLGPKWKKKRRKKKKVGACFGRGTKELPLVWLRQFWSLHGFQSPTVFPRGPRGEKWRQIHGWFMPRF